MLPKTVKEIIKDKSYKEFLDKLTQEIGEKSWVATKQLCIDHTFEEEDYIKLASELGKLHDDYSRLIKLTAAYRELKEIVDTE